MAVRAFRRRSSGPLPERTAPRPPITHLPVVTLAGAGETTRERLRDLARVYGRFSVADDADGSTFDVAVIDVDGADPSGIARLRAIRRAAPTVRTVVVGRGVEGFDAAFEAGADAWIDQGADDGTVLAAILGRP